MIETGSLKISPAFGDAGKLPDAENLDGLRLGWVLSINMPGTRPLQMLGHVLSYSGNGGLRPLVYEASMHSLNL